MSHYDEYGPKWYDNAFENYHKSLRDFKIKLANMTYGLVLDAGAGTGILASVIKNGVFLDFSSVGLGKSWLGNIHDRKIIASVENMPFRNEMFDSVISLETIEHLDDPKTFIKDVHYILKDEGLFLLSFPPITNRGGSHKWKRISDTLINDWFHKWFDISIEILKGQNRTLVCGVKIWR